MPGNGLTQPTGFGHAGDARAVMADIKFNVDINLHARTLTGTRKLGNDARIIDADAEPASG